VQNTEIKKGRKKRDISTIYLEFSAIGGIHAIYHKQLGLPDLTNFFF